MFVGNVLEMWGSFWEFYLFNTLYFFFVFAPVCFQQALGTREPGVITALLEEMVARGDDALKAALGGRNDVRLEPLMAFLIKYVTMPKYSKLLVRICEKVLTMYTKILGQSPVIDDLIFRLHAKIKKELMLQMELLQLNGSIGLLLAQTQKN
jgi:U3 small nucleolar RNA-associated protein 15|tara:strand:+ start:1763 stop:2218 length:456 start_codon:yes stop_codon:yes gene_type:complete